MSLIQKTIKLDLNPVYNIVDKSLAVIINKWNAHPLVACFSGGVVRRFSGNLHSFVDRAVGGRTAGSTVVVPRVGCHRAVHMPTDRGPQTEQFYALRMVADEFYFLTSVGRRYIVFSDCLMAIWLLSADDPGPNCPQIIHEERRDIHLLMSISLQVVVVWIAGQVSAGENTGADKLAKEARTHTTVDHQLQKTSSDNLHVTNNNIF